MKISKWQKVFFVFGLIPTCVLIGPELANSQSEYSKKEISFLKWGNGKNEIGLKEKKVKKIGFPVTFISRSGPTALETDDGGNVYLGDSKNDAAIKINSQSGTLEKIKSSKGRMGEVGFDFEKKIKKINPDLIKIETLGLGRNNFSMKFKNLKKIGASCDETTCKFPDAMQNWVCIGNDENQNLYFYYQVLRQDYRDPYEYVILRLDIKHCLAELIKGEKDDYLDMYSRFSIDKHGNIYQAVSKKDGVHIFKWSH